MNQDQAIQEVLQQMRAMGAQARQAPGDAAQGSQAGGPDFATVLRESVDRVNQAQQEAGQLADAFTRGDPDADLAQVMVALQKANVSFQAMTQVRNKLLSAYQEIMSMQV